MSIFKDSFHPSITEQLKTRQDAINNRTPQNLTYYNSRNAWIRMSSGVDVLKKGFNPKTDSLMSASSYDNTLANQYVLQGGLLYNGNARAGIGDFSNAYSNVGSDGTAYRLGIRPMPGINGVDIKSKGAYGSLRSATVNFQCWDIKQLEDLELLYMRPGYTVLLEWGWSPYLNNKGELVTSVDYTDIINTNWDKEELFSRQYARATDGVYYKDDGTKVAITGYQGNADSMYGYIKNYSWKARMDGGYDCTTEIISMGEIIESLKVNYSPSDNNTYASKGLLSQNITKIDGTPFNVASMSNLSGSYTQNILAGLFYEMHEMIRQQAGGFDPGQSDNEGHSWVLYDNANKKYYDFFRRTINIVGGENEANTDVKIGKTDEQIYITLETLTHVFNDYVLLQDTKNKKPFASISVLESPKSPPITPDPISGSGYLLALAHPLEVSVDPTVCLIKSPLWINGINIKIPVGTADTSSLKPAVQFNHNLPDVSKLTDRLISLGCATDIDADAYDDKRENIANYIKDLIQGPSGKRYSNDQISENVKEIASQYAIRYKSSTYIVKDPDPADISALGVTVKKDNVGKTIKAIFTLDPETFYQLLEDDYAFNLDDKLSKLVITPDGIDPTKSTTAADGDPSEEERQKILEHQRKLDEQKEAGAEGSKFLSKLTRPYFVENKYSTELGIIGNIYININMLYNLCVSDSLSSQDKKEKNEINLYDYIKNVLSKISTAIGEVNTFDIHVDPNGSVARIIDVNYVDRMSASQAYDNAFELQLHNLKSVVRSYSLESKIFPDQASIVAIGAQVGGGALGTDTTTLVDFNRSIRDRIIPIKDAPTSSPQDTDPITQLSTLTNSLGILYSYFTDIKDGWIADGNFDVDKAGKYEGALRDLINFFRTLGKSKTKNKAILPTVLSLDMDGIGGMIIGNIFRINSDILPKGYKNDAGGAGIKLGYIVTGLGHSIKDNDWTTKIEAQTIMLDEPTGLDINFSNLSITPGGSGGTTTIVASVGIGGAVTNVQVKTGGATKTINGKVRTNGEINDLLVSIRQDLYNRHWSSICQSDNKRIRLQAAAMQNLEKMLTDAYAAGIYLKVNSAYRTRADQDRIAADAGKSGLPAAAPGTSNHGFGLAVDLADKNGTRINTTGFSGKRPIPKTLKEWDWLNQNMQKYKFHWLNQGNESHHFNFIG